MEANEFQKKAIEHPVDSPLLIVAGPGSGKTRTIIERILHMLGNGADPSEILCLTFSEKAAEEMVSRLEKAGTDTTDMDIGTFHSFCNRILKDHPLDSEISTSSRLMSKAAQMIWGLSNIDEFELEYVTIGYDPLDTIKPIIEGIGNFKRELVEPEHLEEFIKSQKRKDLPEEGRDFMNKLGDLCKVYRKYQQYLRENLLIDYDDMVAESIKIFKSNDLVLKKYQNKYRHVFVDEFQDNNFAQFELVKLIAEKGNITVVGDDDQCIYRFQGAYLTNFEDFRNTFKSKTIELGKNYRSTQNIVDLTISCINNNPNRGEKRLYSDNEKGDKIPVVKCASEEAEVEFVVKKIRELAGKRVTRRDGKDCPLEYRDFAILSRTKIGGKKFASALKGLGIPTHFTGETDIFSSSIMRDFMTYLKIASSPGTAGGQINRLLANHGLSDINIAKINSAARESARGGPTGTDFVLKVMRNASDLDVTQKEEIADIVRQIDCTIKAARDYGVSRLVYKIIMSISDIFQRTLADDSAHNRQSRALLKKIHMLAQEFENINRDATAAQFINYLYRIDDFDLDDVGDSYVSNSVQIMTMHKSKGKEFPVVFVADVASGRIPANDRGKTFYVPNELLKGEPIDEPPKELHIQEERRLLYVAMTRAQNNLYILYSARYGQGKRETRPSKFLDELEFKTDPPIEFETFEDTPKNSMSRGIAKLEKIKQDKQGKANAAINKMQLQSAVKKILELAEIDHYQKHGNTKGFDPSKVLSVTKDDSDVEAQLNEEKIPLIDKESLSLSASKLETFERCPLQFKFKYLLQVPTTYNSAAYAGTVIHNIIEAVTKRQIEDGVIPEEEALLEILDDGWDSRMFGSQKASNDKKEEAKTWLKTFCAWNKDNPNKLVAVEKKFTLEIGGVKFHGKMDRVDQTPDGKYVVIDYKTGSKMVPQYKVKDDVPLNLYAMATEHLYGDLPEKTVLHYLKNNKIHENVIEESKVNAVKKSIGQFVDQILEEQFSAKPSDENCRSCDFKNICKEKQVDE